MATSKVIKKQLELGKQTLTDMTGGFITQSHSLWVSENSERLDVFSEGSC